MSKSLGNFFTIREVMERYDGETIRFFMLRTHYRSPFNFSDAGLDDARARCAACTRRSMASTRPDREIDWAQPQAATFHAEMNEDFNTPGRGRGAVRAGERSQPHALDRDGRLAQRPRPPRSASCSKRRATTCGRQHARRSRRSTSASPRATRRRRPRDFALADRIRQELLSQGIALKDSAAGHDLGESLMPARATQPEPPADGERRGAAAARRTGHAQYWDEACKHLSKRDRVMRKLIPQFGEGRSCKAAAMRSRPWRVRSSASRFRSRRRSRCGQGSPR